MKFWGVFDLALRGKDETEGSTNPGIFLELVDLAQLDEVFDEHLKNTTVFKGTCKTVQNKLLECMLAVAWERIVEVKSAHYLAIEADETTNVSTQTQLVLVFKYIDDNHAVQERFFEFIPISDSTSVSIASVLLERPNQLLANNKMKLVAQAYDCASVMRGEKAGVAAKGA